MCEPKVVTQQKIELEEDKIESDSSINDTIDNPNLLSCAGESLQKDINEITTHLQGRLEKLSNL